MNKYDKNHTYEEEEHPWDELSVPEILFGLFICGFIIGTIMNLFH